MDEMPQTNPSQESTEGAVTRAPVNRRGPRFTRRQVLTMAGAGGLTGAGILANWLVDDRPTTTGPTANLHPSSTTSKSAATTHDAPPPPATARWSDPATWGGAVPGPGDVAVVGHSVLLDIDATVAGARVEQGGELTFDPASSRTLSSTGNVVVAGALRARPEGHHVVHALKFPRVNEGRFVGDHTMEPLDTDVGLWAVGTGVLDLQGTAKRAWTQLATAAAADDTVITVADAAGWQVGDEVVVTPTEPPSVEGYAEHHDRRVVAALSGATVTLDRPLDHPHPSVTVSPGVTRQAEVLNLTRNVRVEGTPEGRAHLLMLDVAAPQNLGYVGLRHLGPQHAHPHGGVQGVVGRYSLHFHMSFDATRGSVVEGAVAYDGGNHAFVPHLSNGITFRDCIAHDTEDTPFWWDQPADGDELGHIPAHAVTYERCITSLTRENAGSRYSTSGFLLGPGTENAARSCVAVGGLASDEANAGFKWVGDAHEVEGTWTFENCVSHNNNGSSIYFWVNGVPHSYVDRFTAYHDNHGIRAGSYTNLVSYRDTTVYGCGEVGLYITAVPGDDDPPGRTVTYENLRIDQAGLSDFAVIVGGHVVEALQHTLVTGGWFGGGARAQVGFPEPGEYPQLYEFLNCTYDGNAFWLAHPLTDVVDIRVRDAVHGSLTLRPAGKHGELRIDWNAAVSAG
jgi:hypothetical protein